MLASRCSALHAGTAGVRQPIMALQALTTGLRGAARTAAAQGAARAPPAACLRHTSQRAPVCSSLSCSPSCVLPITYALSPQPLHRPLAACRRGGARRGAPAPRHHARGHGRGGRCGGRARGRRPPARVHSRRRLWRPVHRCQARVLDMAKGQEAAGGWWRAPALGPGASAEWGGEQGLRGAACGRM
jgi:hypothetical protein